MKTLFLTLFSLVALATASFATFPPTFTVNNLGTPQFNGTYVIQDANAEYPVYVNQSSPEHVLFASGPPPGMPFIPPTWRFSKFTGYTGTGSMNGLPKEDFYLKSGNSFQPLQDPFTGTTFVPSGSGVYPAPGDSGSGFSFDAPESGSGEDFTIQAQELNIGLVFQDGQWTPAQ